MRPQVRTRRSMERRGGRDSGKSVNGAMFGVVTRHICALGANRAQLPNRAGSLHLRRYLYSPPPANGGCEGGRTVKNGKKGCKPADGRPENVDKLRIRNAVRIPWGERAVFSA